MHHKYFEYYTQGIPRIAACFVWFAFWMHFLPGALHIAWLTPEGQSTIYFTPICLQKHFSKSFIISTSFFQVISTEWLSTMCISANIRAQGHKSLSYTRGSSSSYQRNWPQQSRKLSGRFSNLQEDVPLYDGPRVSPWWHVMLGPRMQFSWTAICFWLDYFGHYFRVWCNITGHWYA